MIQRKAPPAASLLYAAPPAADWVRTLTQFIDDSLAVLCVRQWQRATIVVPQRVAVPRRPR